MPSHLPKSFSRPFLKIFHVLEAVLLVAITLATVWAMVEEFIHIYVQKRVSLDDILLMFIYLEVLAMVGQFVMNGKIPVRYPIYIAMMVHCSLHHAWYERARLRDDSMALFSCVYSDRGNLGYSSWSPLLVRI